MYSEETRYASKQGRTDASLRDLPSERSVGCCCEGNGREDSGVTLLPRDLAGMKLCELPIAMAYVPPQSWRDIFETDVALREGTHFRELALPFTAEKSQSKGGICRG